MNIHPFLLFKGYSRKLLRINIAAEVKWQRGGSSKALGIEYSSCISGFHGGRDASYNHCSCERVLQTELVQPGGQGASGDGYRRYGANSEDGREARLETSTRETSQSCSQAGSTATSS